MLKATISPPNANKWYIAIFYANYAPILAQEDKLRTYSSAPFRYWGIFADKSFPFKDLRFPFKDLE